MSVAMIAKRAGVSPATVSRVLHDSSRVNPETARLVRDVIRAGNFDLAALRRRGPRLRGSTSPDIPAKSPTLGVISLAEPHDTWFRQPIFAAVVAALSRQAGLRNSRVLIDDYTDPSRPCAAVREGAIDGAFVFIPTPADPALLTNLSRAVPVVRLMGEELPGTHLDHIQPDHLAIGHIAFDHLRAHGVTRLAFITTHSAHEAFVLRGVGFCLAAARAGFAPPAIYCVDSESRGLFGATPVRPYASLDEVAESIATTPEAERPDALFISEDRETIGLYPLLERRGLAPGRLLKVISCNNEHPILTFLSPRPPSIDIGPEEMARRAVDCLLSRIHNPHQPPSHILVPPRLVLPDNEPTEQRLP